MNLTQRISAADHIVAMLAAHTDVVFGVGGANIEDIYDALHRSHSPITGIVAKHEFNAATMADGYARTTNRLGVVAATSGGGAMNLVAALAESYDAQIPVLALVGQPPRALEGRGAFQDTSGLADTIDAQRLFATISRYCVKVTEPEDIVTALPAAIDAAMAGGPAVLLLPKDVQTAALTVGSASVARDSGSVTEDSWSETRMSAVAALVRAGASGAVVIVAGSEVARCDARAELAAFARALGAPVAVTPDAKDVFANGDPQFAGVTGIMGHPHVADVIKGASLCVVVGATLPVTARGGLEDAFASCAQILHLGVRAPFIEPTLRVQGPVDATLRAMTEALPPLLRSPTPTSSSTLKPPAADGPGVRYRDAVGAIERWLEPGVDVFADAGNTGAAVVHLLPVPDGSRFVVALGMGGMGYSFGAGIGSAIGRRRRTVVIAGDGAYFMCGHEVHTAVQHAVPVTFIVFNNNAHAMCVTREQLYYSGEYSYNRFGPARIGESVSALFPSMPAYAAATLDEFETALNAVRHVPGPAFIALDCDPDEIPPFAPFLG